MRATQGIAPAAAHPLFLLDPEVTFLNHGSFGACPAEVLAAQDGWRREMEREPVDFLARRLPGLLAQARACAATFVGADAAGLAFVPNATSGIAAVLDGLSLGPGDELLTTTHRYDAVRNAMDRAAARAGARVVEAAVPFPIEDGEQAVRAVAGALSPRTRILVVDQVTSPTALLLPVAAIARRARERGVPVLVDGAHAPGQVDLDVCALGADWWVGNLHKWTCAPKGTALLWAAPDRREALHAQVTSHGFGKGIHEEFDWPGTFDPTAWLASTAAIDLHEAMGGPTFRAANHALVARGREAVADALGARLPHPDDPSLYGSMAAIELPVAPDRARDLNLALYEADRVEVPTFAWGGRAWVRISGFAAYNVPEHYDRLARALRRALE